MYLILGCGYVGFTLASRLRECGAELAVIDNDSEKVKWLKEMDYNAFLGDFSSPRVLKKAEIERAEVVLVMVSNFQDTERALGALKEVKAELGVDPIIVARVRDESEIREAKSLGAKDALPSSQIFADFALHRFGNSRR